MQPFRSASCSDMLEGALYKFSLALGNAACGKLQEPSATGAQVGRPGSSQLPLQMVLLSQDS